MICWSASINGDLLQRVYLQTIQALSLDEQDKTRVKVTDLDVQVNATHPRKRETASSRMCDGPPSNRGPLGHEHQRVNRYIAKVTIAPVAGKPTSQGTVRDAWKMIDLDIQEEEKAMRISRPLFEVGTRKEWVTLPSLPARR